MEKNKKKKAASLTPKSVKQPSEYKTREAANKPRDGEVLKAFGNRKVPPRKG